MNPRIVVHELRLEGGGRDASYRFGPGVNVVLGAVGTGKSSLLELIKYGFGGGGVLSGAVRQGVTAAVLDVDLGETRYLLRRAVDTRDIEVRSGATGALIERCHTQGTKQERNVSDALLEFLGLPRLEVPRSRAAPSAETTPVTFFDVLSYLYARQSEIDRSVVNHLDPLRDPKRRATFEVMYGLTDEGVAALQREIGRVRSEVEDTKRRNRHIESFLREGEEPTEDELRLELESLNIQRQAAERRLQQLRQGVRAETPFVDEDRTRIASLEADLDSARHDEAAAEAEQAHLESVAAQLELDAQRISRSLIAGELLAPIEYMVCPRCHQSIRDRDRQPGVCILCGQAQSPQETEARLEAERSRIADQRAETLALSARTRDQIAAARNRIAALLGAVMGTRTRIDERTAAFVSPLMDEIEGASREVERMDARRTAVLRSLELWRRYRDGLGLLKELEARLDSLSQELSLALEGLEEGRERVRNLSSLFDELLREFRYPWYRSARIDPETYLPVVNEEAFIQASGGMKTLINVAYHVAGLRYGLRYRDSLLPLFLMLDSPRKNLGAENVDDKLIGSQIYRRFRTMQDANPNDFQLIVADNDVPVGTQAFAAVQLSYEQPLIPWVRHPGPDRVTPIE